MKKILLFIILVFSLVGCSEAAAKLHMNNDEKRIMLGMMQDATIDEFHLTGNVKINLNEKYQFDIKVDSYNLNDYILNYLTINNNNALVFVKDEKIYVNYQGKSEYINLKDINNELLFKVYGLISTYINQLSLDSPEALDALTIYSYFLGHQFVYHFTKDTLEKIVDDEFLNYISNDSFLTLTLNYTGNILSSIDIKTNIKLQNNTHQGSIEGDLHLDLKFDKPKIPDVSKYQKVDKFSFIDTSNFA
ncbi:MAG TPA: hypothetical protein VIK94_01475 [Bacilli bacterium]